MSLLGKVEGLRGSSDGGEILCNQGVATIIADPQIGKGATDQLAKKHGESAA
jgi:hypothetical protein